jgi:RNA polymerase sigma-32 factor
VDESDDQEIVLAEYEEAAYRKSLLPSALSELTTRGRHIVVERRLKESPMTLQDLLHRYGISRERVRQNEARAKTKLRRSVRAAAAGCGKTSALHA